MRKWIDLNSDMGESFGNYVLGRPEEVMKLISHANVACGFHAGDPTWMRRTVEWAKKYNVTLGAHPGFPDRMGFGRRLMNITQQEASDYVIYQAGALKGFADGLGVKLEAGKPHGAFYLWCLQSEENARAVLEAFRSLNPDFVLYWPALPLHPMIETAERMGMRVVKEFYPGLGYSDEGALTIKRSYGEESIQEMVDLVMEFALEGTTTSVNGKKIKVDAESVCVHGDVTNAPEVVRALREALERAGIEVRSALRAEPAPSQRRASA